MPDVQDINFEPLTSAVAARYARVNTRQWRGCCEDFAARGGHLVALWGSDAGGAYEVHAALADTTELVVLTLPLAVTVYPDIGDIFPAAIRLQRAARDLLGICAAGAADERKWLRHAAWREDEFPLRKSAGIGDAQGFVNKR